LPKGLIRKETNGRDLIGAGMHLLRQFEREALEVDRKGRKQKSKAVVAVVRGHKSPSVNVKISEKKTLETLSCLPLAGLRRGACVKRKQRKLSNQQKHFRPRQRKAVRSTWKSPVKARHDSLKKYQQRFAKNKGFWDGTSLFKRRRAGSFSYDMVPMETSWADLVFWLSELFPKLYFRKLARFGKSRKVRRAGFSRRIRKSRRKEQKTKKRDACKSALGLRKAILSIPDRCVRCGMSLCMGREGLQFCTEKSTWRTKIFGYKKSDDEGDANNMELGELTSGFLSSPLREVINCSETGAETVRKLTGNERRKVIRGFYPKHPQVCSVVSSKDWPEHYTSALKAEKKHSCNKSR